MESPSIESQQQEASSQLLEVKINIEFTDKRVIELSGISSQDSISSIKERIQTQEEIPTNNQRLLYNSGTMEDGKTLGDYGIVNGSTIRLVPRLRDIGEFGYDMDSIGAHFLISDEFRNYNKDDIKSLIHELKGDINSKYKYYEINEVIKEQELEKIKMYVDEQYSNMGSQKREDMDDFKITLAKRELIKLVGDSLLRYLESLFKDDYGEILIRRCQVHGKFINFHTDVSLKTLQLALNGDDEYEGGRLVYACGGEKLIAPKRSAGSVTIHDNKIVHGVSTLKSGTRYGLFLLKKSQHQVNQ